VGGGHDKQSEKDVRQGQVFFFIIACSITVSNTTCLIIMCTKILLKN